MRVPSRCRPRRFRPAVAEVYAVAMIVAMTVALAAFAYSQAHYPVSRETVYSLSSYSILGSPSILHLQVNSSVRVSLSEVRLDSASSESGVLALVGGGYTTVESLCGPRETTFFSVEVAAGGAIQVEGNGSSWIDGEAGPEVKVEPGVHEIMISNSPGCRVELPGGAIASFPSAQVSSAPEYSTSSSSAVLLIPYVASPHSVTLVLSGGIETFDF